MQRRDPRRQLCNPLFGFLFYFLIFNMVFIIKSTFKNMNKKNNYTNHEKDDIIQNDSIAQKNAINQKRVDEFMKMKPGDVNMIIPDSAYDYDFEDLNNPQLKKAHLYALVQ